MNELALEHAVVLQEQRVLVLRRQVFRGERYASSRLKRLEREYFICKRRLEHTRRHTLLSLATCERD
jgi:hypothetical protein